MDELVQSKADQAVLQEGPSPTQVIGTVSRHVGQAPGKGQGDRQWCLWAGLWGEQGSCNQGWRPSCHVGQASNFHAGVWSWHFHTLRPPSRSGCQLLGWGWTTVDGTGEGRADSLLTDDVKVLADFQMAPGLEGKSWMWLKNNGVRQGGGDGTERED
jgi:hypothetical protein